MSILSDPSFPLYLMLMLTSFIALSRFIAICCRHQMRSSSFNASDHLPSGSTIANMPLAQMISNNIPAHKYREAETSRNLVGEDRICTVCLGKFKEGEELQTLLECLHSFHVSCIDMWLLSHTNCPICRADQFPR